MERDTSGGSDVGRDTARDLGDEPPASYRDAPPEYLAPIDDSAPVSGHIPAPDATGSAIDSPEHDWARAQDLIYPSFKPVGTQGLDLATLDRDALVAQGAISHAQPLIDGGPAGIPIVYLIDAGQYDIVVNGDHLLSWGVGADDIRDAAMQNLGRWSASAPWTDETSGERRLVSSDSGDGWDAARILLPAAIAHLTTELAPYGRVLVGIPERHLLTAATLRPDDPEFADLFAEFVLEQSGGADEPVDRRVFELVDGRLIEFDGGGRAGG